MYVVTNRRIEQRSGDLGIISKEPNEKGPNELRLLKISKKDGKHRVELCNDDLPQATSNRLARILKLEPGSELATYRSLAVAYEFFSEAVKDGTHILIFVNSSWPFSSGRGQKEYFYAPSRHNI